MVALKTRQELNPEETWDLSLLFPSQAAFLEKLEACRNQAEAFNQTYAGNLKDAKTLISALDQLEAIERDLTWLYAYGSLGYEVDKNDPQHQENVNLIPGFFETVGSHLSFVKAEIAQLDQAVIDQVIADPHGQIYEPYLSNVLLIKPHLLSAEVEKALSSLNGTLNAFYPTYGALKFQDMTFDDFEANGQTYPNSFVSFENDYEGHLDPAIRQGAWESFHQGLAKYQHTAAANYIHQVKKEKKMATLRGFDSVFDFLLFEQKVSRQAYDRQIDVIMAEFAPVMRRYARLLAKEQGLDQVSLADIKMPFTSQAAEQISIDQARQMMEEVFEVFGPEYLEIVKQSFDERWIDFPMNQTKSTGGFCSTIYQGPSYILLNWTGLLSEVLVLAHELGHAGHFNLTYKNQLALTPEVSLYFVEAPSTANEVITCQYLLNQPIDDLQKRLLIAEFISRTYFHNMVTHLLEADFQRKVYKAVDAGQLLTAEILNDYFKETLENFWGKDLYINPGAELTWMRQPHYFMGLYPYTYSAGLTVGTQIGQRIAQGDQAAIDAWLEVLKAGGTLSPLELAEKAGVSMHDATALRSAIAYVDGLLDQIEALKS
ncbi:TPA: oligoendopeptidase F [Streptococcus suis]